MLGMRVDVGRVGHLERGGCRARAPLVVRSSARSSVARDAKTSLRKFVARGRTSGSDAAKRAWRLAHRHEEALFEAVDKIVDACKEEHTELTTAPKADVNNDVIPVDFTEKESK